MQSNFLHENTVFMGNFIKRSIKKLQFWDFTVMITYYVADSFQNGQITKLNWVVPNVQI